MKKEYDGYTVVPYPPVRKMTADILELAHPKHMIHAFVEVDVTRARRFIQEYEAETGGGSLLHSIRPHLPGEGGDQEQVHARLSERAQ